MKDHLKPYRNLEAEKQLKAIIQQIEVLMDNPQNTYIIENLLKESVKFIKGPDKVLDLTVIENYESWTNIDDLVRELTTEIPVLSLTREELADLVEEIISVRDKKTGKILSEAEHGALVQLFEKSINHPGGSDLIYYPELVGLPPEPTVDEIVDLAIKGISEKADYT